MNNQQTSAPIACDLTQIPSEQLPKHEDRARYLFGQGTQERKELPDGFAFRFSPQDYSTIVDFIAHERLCCPFFNFTLELQPNVGPIWLRITGPEGVKPLLQAASNDIALSKVTQ